MLPKKCILVCIINLLCSFSVLAQGKAGYITGHIKDTENHPIISVSVYLLSAADSGVVKFTVTNKEGSFKFDGIKTGTYLISASAVGYMRTLSGKIQFSSSASFDAGVLSLKSLNKNLKEVAVIAEKKFIEVESDKIILNVKSSNLFVGNTALDVLRKSNGVQVDNNGGISLFGKSDVLVMIDNKPTYLSGTALTDLLQGTQSSVIDKIELISNPNSTYDAAGTGGIINIKLVRDKNTGINAQITGGAGLSQFPGGEYSGIKRNLGLNFNYRNKKLNIFGNYTYSNAPYYQSSVSDRFDIYNGHNDIVSVDWLVNQRKESNNFRIGADYNITSKHSIGFLISAITASTDGPKNTKSVIVTNNNVADSSIQTHSQLNKNFVNVAYNLNYKGDLGKGGEISVNADYLHYSRKYDELIQSNYFYNPGTSPYRNLTLQNNSPSNFDFYIFSADYHKSINEVNSFSAGFKSSMINTNNYSNFGSVLNQVYTPFGSFTGQFYYKENIHAGYADYNHIFDKTTSIELGARVEQTISDGLTSNTGQDVPNNYFSVFPNVKLNHNININNQLILSYSRRVTRPDYAFLNPLLIYSDQYTYQIGNQYLKPFYANKLDITHIYKEKYISSFSFEAVEGFTQIIYMQSDQTQSSTLKRVNLGNRYNYVLNFIIPLKVTKWYSADFNLDARYQQFTGSSPAGNLDKGSTDVTITTHHYFNLPFSTQLSLGTYYETPTTFGIYRYKAEYYAFGGITKSLFKKQAILHLQVDGIFNSDKNVYTTQYQNLNLSGTQIDKFRSITLSFNYALGSKTIKAARKRDSEADEEKARAGSL